MSERVHVALSEGMAESAAALREQASRTLDLAKQEAARMTALAAELEDAAETLAAVGDPTPTDDHRRVEPAEPTERVEVADVEGTTPWAGPPWGTLTSDLDSLRLEGGRIRRAR